MGFLSFRGRATQSEYWRYAWIPFLAVPGIGAIIFVPVAILVFNWWAPMAIASLFGVAVLVQMVTSPLWLGITVRRLHDTSRSAWLLLPYAVISVGWVLIVLSFLATDQLILRFLIDLWGIIWAFVSWALVIKLLMFCSGLGTVGSNRYGPQPGVVEESGGGDTELTPPKSTLMKESTRIIKPVLRVLGFSVFGLFAVVAVMALLAIVIVLGLATGNCQIMEGNLPNPEPTEAFPLWSIPSKAPPRWTPDGGQIVFAHQGKVYAVYANGTTLRLIHGGEGEEAHYYSPSVSPDGTRIVYLKNYRRWPWESRYLEIATSALDGTDERVLTDLKLANVNDDEYELGSPSWSPDGSRIAFIGRDKIYTIAADGSDLQVVTGPVDPPGLTYYVFRNHLREFLVWSPDGRRLAFAARVRDREPDEPLEIHTIGLDGSDARKMGQGYSVPACSPDGGRLAFADVTREGDRLLQLYTVGSDGSDPLQIASTRVPITGDLSGVTSWSPDGSEILTGPVVAKEDGSEFRLLPVLEGDDGPITDLYSHGFTSQSPDGSRIAVQGSHRVYAVARDGSSSRVKVLVRLDGDLPDARPTSTNKRAR